MPSPLAIERFRHYALLTPSLAKWASATRATGGFRCNCNETPLQHMFWRRKSPESLYAQNKNSFSSSKWFAMSVISKNHSPRCWKSSLPNSGHEPDSPPVTFSHSPFLRCFSPSIHSFLPYPQVGNFIVPFSFRCLCISNEFHSKCGSWPHPFLKHSNSALSK